MPTLAPNSWKCFCLLLRQTVGWHRDDASMSYPDLRDGTGISSNATVTNAMKELVARGLTIKVPGQGSAKNTFKINRQFEIQIERTDDGQWKAENVDQSQRGVTYQLAVPFQHLGEQAAGRVRSERPTITGLRAAIQDEIAAAPSGVTPGQSNKVSILRATCSLVYGGQELPGYARVGGFAKQVGGHEEAVRLLFRYAGQDVQGNPVRYVLAARARERRARETGQDPFLPKEATHLEDYTWEEVERFTGMGYEEAHFHQAGHERGTTVYKYVDPKQQ